MRLLHYLDIENFKRFGDKQRIELDYPAVLIGPNNCGKTRQAGFAPIQHEQMVLSYIAQHGRIRRAEVMDLCRLSSSQAGNLLKLLKSREKIVQHGRRKGAFYTEGGA
ncbi:MAG: hypothetical protein MUE46_18375 [Xanthomonadales bacterium]|jgi:hypothetical protein|nr:hypothetical protein [Xanthomonadales bacterium]